MTIARAPGKVVVAGEYAVLSGYNALSMAIDRYAVAEATTQPSDSPVLLALHRGLTERLGEAGWFTVDTESFQESGRKLGLGSSAACVVAATQLALPESTKEDLLAVAFAAHREGQLARGSGGSGGSGIDVATSVYGGVLEYRLIEDAPNVKTCQLPDDAVWVFVDAGQSADTKVFLTKVDGFSKANPAAHSARMAQLGEAASGAVGAQNAADLIEALTFGREAILALAKDTKLALELDTHRACALLAGECGGVAKSTGAAGGDVIAGCFSSQDSAQWFVKSCNNKGLQVVELSVSELGCHLQGATIG